MTRGNRHKDILFGLAVGDALGVPVEFRSRESISQRPVTGMKGHQETHKFDLLSQGHSVCQGGFM